MAVTDLFCLKRQWLWVLSWFKSYMFTTIHSLRHGFWTLIPVCREGPGGLMSACLPSLVHLMFLHSFKKVGLLIVCLKHTVAERKERRGRKSCIFPKSFSKWLPRSGLEHAETMSPDLQLPTWVAGTGAWAFSHHFSQLHLDGARLQGALMWDAGVASCGLTH